MVFLSSASLPTQISGRKDGDRKEGVIQKIDGLLYWSMKGSTLVSGGLRMSFRRRPCFPVQDPRRSWIHFAMIGVPGLSRSSYHHPRAEKWARRSRYTVLFLRCWNKLGGMCNNSSYINLIQLTKRK